MAELNISRMPTRSEILMVTGSHSLHDAIVRNNGYYEWANTLNLKIKKSDTELGKIYERVCNKELLTKGYNVETTTQNASYDLIINENIRVDVKSACAYDLRGSRVHTFGINKKFPSCDIYILYALDEEATNIERTLIIPSKDLKVVSMSIGTNSKYNKYIDRWDYIDMYDKFYQSI